MFSGKNTITVDCLMGSANPEIEEDEIFTKTLWEHEPFPDYYKSIKPGDAVLCIGNNYNAEFHISRVFTKNEERVLQLGGVEFPEVPPELLPHGYYG